MEAVSVQNSEKEDNFEKEIHTLSENLKTVSFVYKFDIKHRIVLCSCLEGLKIYSSDCRHSTCPIFVITNRADSNEIKISNDRTSIAF